MRFLDFATIHSITRRRGRVGLRRPLQRLAAVAQGAEPSVAEGTSASSLFPLNLRVDSNHYFQSMLLFFEHRIPGFPEVHLLIIVLKPGSVSLGFRRFSRQKDPWKEWGR